MNKTLTRLEALKDLVQDAIDQGATTVEQIHKRIVDLPLSVLEKNGLLDVDSDKRDEMWNKSIGHVYEAIRRVNQEIGDLASQAFEAVDDQLIIQQNIREAAELEELERAGRAKVIESSTAVEPQVRVADAAPVEQKPVA
ncbi:hypothetical protein EV700_2379 [Fluviicoccus keumensis]|uniref:Uncharacterized protein n=1 Tax=Fluviicoccus keumensis TaxID=1435465 RepID=A0A4Q7YLK4_9GAMM|nr:hypothetical protein [Fluviicoccus keumensis]RZU38447.1 hypothetical protein EV700_2379 [Fluviicoccus keumensis]